jgi:hypothetical protein
VEDTRTFEHIDAMIEQKKRDLERVEGTPTEVYTRIVGYYRSLKNWNPGKRSEYVLRKVFDPETSTVVTRNVRVPATQKSDNKRDSFIPGKAPFKGVADFKAVDL